MSQNSGLPPIDFSTFLLSLSTSAMIQLGQAPHPHPEGATLKDLEMAKQTIDIIGMLQQKTKGNLSAQEHELIENLLADLRMRFVASSK